MTDVSRDDVRHLAALSSLQLSEGELDSLTGDITNILTHIERLGELDTHNVEPTYQVTDLENVWREDTVEIAKPTGETLVAMAPESQNNQIKVPKVLG